VWEYRFTQPSARSRGRKRAESSTFRGHAEVARLALETDVLQQGSGDLE
jgi:hypothetical protein